MVRSWLLSHPAEIGESYLEHMQVAGSFGLRLLGAGLACLLHAFVPCLFERTGSRMVKSLHERLVIGRAAQGPARACSDQLESADGPNML